MRDKRISIFLTALFLVIISLSVAGAQAPTRVQTLGTVTEPHQDSLGLGVYFVATDGTGRPIFRPSFSSAEIQVLGRSDGPMTATVGDPGSDIYVVLLLDTSGSMRNVIEKVREAALEAWETLPPNARISVIAFNDRTMPMTDFTSDFEGVKAAISRVRVEDKGTCLYDAVFEAIERLDRALQKPQDRRAIILFTDGRDQRTARLDDPCSVHTYVDVLTRAAKRPATPIHTIGLCVGNCSNVNGTELRNIAAETRAFSALGGEANLSSMFQEIMDGLNSQLVARAEVYANKGENQAVLRLKPQDAEIVIASEPFVFVTDREFGGPPPPVGVLINSLEYDPTANVYHLSASVASPELVQRLVVRAEETEGGTIALEKFINLEDRATVQIEIETSGFKAGRKYTIKIQAIDPQGQLVEKPSEGMVGIEEDRTILGSKEFSYEPPAPKGAEFTVESVNPDFAGGTLLISLNVADESRVQIYQGYIVNAAKQRVLDFGPDVYRGSQLQVGLPDAMKQSADRKEQEYQLTVFLTTADEQQTQAILDFKVLPPRPPSIFQRIFEALKANPIIVLSILVVILAVVLWRVIFNRREQRRKLAALPRPPISRTEIMAPQAPQAPQRRLKVRIIKTPGDVPETERLFTAFPCAIGRRGCDFNLPNDTQVSRRHAEIMLHNGELYLTDLGSTNGTSVNNVRLEPRKPLLLQGQTTVQLGHFTEIELECL